MVNLTPEEKQIIINVLTQLRLSREEWITAEQIIKKLSEETPKSK